MQIVTLRLVGDFSTKFVGRGAAKPSINHKRIAVEEQSLGFNTVLEWDVDLDHQGHVIHADPRHNKLALSGNSIK